MATIDGARALGLEKEIGSLEAGKLADLIIVDLDCLHSSPRPSEMASAVVYSAQASDVRDVFVNGQGVMRERELVTMNEREVIDEANREASLLRQRAGV
jgi:cytosine/adenosine deaminase-related metal-dependent hydrolase